ncbi:hypothetical protein [Roseibium aggregatum]|uniref:hypothetical protein n=1 Tax=Roseibium aggregatum TaxID=187304 RepID=UPI001E407315|nr:hypothetical protein [Roseibium aggregatum]UES37643.1 hypothetical protein GFC08_07075 [Roseibium aggregatum]
MSGNTTEVEKASLRLKLDRLHDQALHVSSSEYSYAAVGEAASIIRNLIQKHIARIEDYHTFPRRLQENITQRSIRFIIQASEILGTLSRSSSIRNPFEWYAEYSYLASKLAGDDTKLIFSSEWSYIPFTYPKNLEQLPDFIIIGMPASESDNVLTTPAAAHELGHSIWRHRNVEQTIGVHLQKEAQDLTLKSEKELKRVFSELDFSKISTDLFAQHVFSQIWQTAFKYAMMQSEEVFCDFIGVLLFEDAYLRAFHYLIAPNLSTYRSPGYPDTKKRAQILNKYATSLRFGIDRYEDFFLPDHSEPDPLESIYLNLADQVLEKYLDELFKIAENMFHQNGLVSVNREEIDNIVQHFTNGVPYPEIASIRELVIASWKIYVEDFHKDISKTRALSDIVLKSAEYAEFLRSDDARN